jgi:hypothetical protein
LLRQVRYPHQKVFHQFRTGRAYLVGRLHGGQKDIPCPDCGDTKDSVEHFMKCPEHQALHDFELCDLFTRTKMADAAAAIYAIWVKRRRARTTHVPIDVLTVA